MCRMWLFKHSITVGWETNKMKKAIEIVESYAYTHLFLWLRYGAVTSCCLKFNELHLRKRMKGRQESERWERREWDTSHSKTLVYLAFGTSFMTLCVCIYLWCVCVIWRHGPLSAFTFFSLVYTCQIPVPFDVYTHSCISNSGAWRKQHQSNDFNSQEMHYLIKCTLWMWIKESTKCIN